MITLIFRWKGLNEITIAQMLFTFFSLLFLIIHLYVPTAWPFLTRQYYWLLILVFYLLTMLCSFYFFYKTKQLFEMFSDSDFKVFENKKYPKSCLFFSIIGLLVPLIGILQLGSRQMNPTAGTLFLTLSLLLTFDLFFYWNHRNKKQKENRVT